ncbi:MAG TPA: rRNA maturation RNase YbeY [Bacteroidales bacterium]|jgi:probable rRNA maturation factor|nr:rRNA maturation RNase YbeY [Bacteroidales bacterium]
MILFHIQAPTVKISNRRAIKRWIQQVLKEKGKEAGDINIILCNSDEVLELNKKYLNHNYQTDVITFPYSHPDELRLSGDVFIDVQTVAKNATLYRQTMSNELLRVIIHGILHLTGMNDQTEEELKLMRRAEDRALEQIREKKVIEIKQIK